MRIIRLMVSVLGALLLALSPAMASVIFYDINISGLTNIDLAAFDVTVSFDEGVFDFQGYELTEEMGSFEQKDAEDWSLGDTGGEVNLSAISYLPDLSDQSDAFSLGRLIFSFDSDADVSQIDPSLDIQLTNIELSDTLGNAIPFVVSGNNISAVPIPAAAWLFGTGLIGLVGIRGRRDVL